MKPEVSIIVRTKNEKKWVLKCLYGIFSQKFSNFEVLLVDNNSNDGTIGLVKKNFPKVKILKFKPRTFFPGQALNFGASKSKGEYLVFISGHCIPKNDTWLSFLIKNIKNKKTAGVYGCQEPLDNSDPNDVRDLIYLFGKDRKVQTKDPFFHNANSIIKRNLWVKNKFDERTPHIEDRLWAENLLSKGFKIVYEPRASVYHHHGLNYRGNEKRIKRISNILTTRSVEKKIKKLSCIIPILDPLKIEDKFVVERLITDVVNIKFIDKIFIICNDKSLLLKLKNKKIKFVKRERSLEKDFIGADFVLVETYKNKIKKLTNSTHLLILEEPYVLRPKNFLKTLIKNFDSNYETLIPICKSRHHNLWKKNEVGELEVLFKTSLPSSMTDHKIFQEVRGLGCIVEAKSFEKNGRNSKNVKFLEIDSDSSFKITKKMIDYLYK